MADKFLYLNAGVPTEKEATVTSAGAGDTGKLVALDSTGRIGTSMMPVGIAADTASILASEALATGDFVNIYNNAGTPTCRKADASAAGKQAHGFVLEAVSSAALATVYFEGANTQVTGMVAGQVYLSAATAGKAVAAAPSGTGQVVQNLGVATSATSINVEINQFFILA